VFGKLADAQANVLVLSPSPETAADLEWFLTRYPMQMAPADRRVLTVQAQAHRDLLQTLDDLIDPNYVPVAVAMALPGRSYQLRESEIYLRAGGLLVADVVGLGKTATAIISFLDPRTRPAVVVCLAHLPKQWEKQIAKFAPALRVHRIGQSTPYALPLVDGRGPDVVILSYHKLDGWAKVLSSYGQSIVFDEAQELRHSDTNRYRAARAIADAVKFRLGLSATPIYNYGGEIFNVLDMIRPGALGTRTEFLREWCTEARGGEKAILKDPQAFGAWARDQFLIVRHTRKEVGRELPPIQRIPHTVDTDPAALSAVQGRAAEMARIILGQVAATDGDRLQANAQLNALLRQATGVAKAPYVAEFVRLLIEAGETVLLFGWHRAVYDIWVEKLKDLAPLLYTGTESPAAKAEAERLFVTGQRRLLIMSLRSGAGVDGLQEVCRVVVFGELDWSPGVHEQCIGRVARDGQDDPTLAYFLVSDEGSDPSVAETLGLKRAQVEGIRDPQKADLPDQIDPHAARKLAADYLAQLTKRRRRT